MMLIKFFIDGDNSRPPFPLFYSASLHKKSSTQVGSQSCFQKYHLKTLTKCIIHHFETEIN